MIGRWLGTSDPNPPTTPLFLYALLTQNQNKRSLFIIKSKKQANFLTFGLPVSQKIHEIAELMKKEEGSGHDKSPFDDQLGRNSEVINGERRICCGVDVSTKIYDD